MWATRFRPRYSDLPAVITSYPHALLVSHDEQQQDMRSEEENTEYLVGTNVDMPYNANHHHGKDDEPEVRFTWYQSACKCASHDPHM